ncbi:hypothetical protein NLM27_27355 [Bradyrhizobium sp. CCGB12]|uniref:hypothetical protein n=1 Tax=Bradyrhizobium sp. CCGB12 TaxID=2949632 RepID=UPI0020B34C5D|nr:hypothetical protein [Bradyrhizobium sp. CCGB12]MCP3392468.1 hypothetical protein [Bradyrhizobium sp. CCGB12]
MAKNCKPLPLTQLLLPAVTRENYVHWERVFRARHGGECAFAAVPVVVVTKPETLFCMGNSPEQAFQRSRTLSVHCPLAGSWASETSVKTARNKVNEFVREVVKDNNVDPSNG